MSAHHSVGVRPDLLPSLKRLGGGYLARGVARAVEATRERDRLIRAVLAPLRGRYTREELDRPNRLDLGIAERTALEVATESELTRIARHQ